MSFLNTIKNYFLDTVFPIKCLSCNAPGVDICIDCLALFPPAERESAAWIFPIFDYRHPPVKKALWLFKYKGKKGLTKILANIMYDSIIEELSDLYQMENFTNPILIPIPLSRKRYRERGYNQAELICQELIRIDNLRYSVDTKESFGLENDILIKTKETMHQAHIENRRERLRNIVGSFAIKNPEKNESKIKNRNIILIDDITTTGATLTEAKKILKQHGARKIIAFTIAH